jgi:superfamily II DNA or RNA helicase
VPEEEVVKLHCHDCGNVASLDHGPDPTTSGGGCGVCGSANWSEEPDAPAPVTTVYMKPSFTPESYQLEAARWLSRRKRGLVQAPAGAGKTILAAMALDFAIRARQRDRAVRIGWVCNTREQKEQGLAAIGRFESILAQRAQGMANLRVECAAAAADWSDRDVLVVDEAHHLMAPEWLKQVGACPGAIWGMTATPEVEDEFRDRALIDFFQRQLFVVPREAVQNRLVKARVVMLRDSDDNGEQMKREIDKLVVKLSRFSSQDEAFRNACWQVVRSTGIAHNAQRNRAGIERATHHVNRGEQVLVLVNDIEHGAFVAEAVPRAHYCNSKMGVKKRREVLEGFRTGELKCLVATSLADEGLDLPMARVLVLLSGGRSRVKAEQRTGRVLRAFAGKEEGLIYDFLDLQHPLMAKQARARISLYRELGYLVQREDGVELPLA